MYEGLRPGGGRRRRLRVASCRVGEARRFELHPQTQAALAGQERLAENASNESLPPRKARGFRPRQWREGHCQAGASCCSSTRLSSACVLPSGSALEDPHCSQRTPTEIPLAGRLAPQDSCSLDAPETDAETPSGIQEPANESDAIERLEALSLYEDSGGARKVSRAQRRREKKQLKLRERELMLDEARGRLERVEGLGAGEGCLEHDDHGFVGRGASSKENNLGEEEWAALANELEKEGLTIFSVPGDGNCLFRSIAHQLELNPSANGELDVKRLRGGIADLMKRERDCFKAFLDEQLQQDEAYDAFCENIRSSQDWGGEIEILAASQLLRCPIKVYAVSDAVTVLTYGEEFCEAQPLRLAFHRFLLAAGPHYNSIVPMPQTSEAEN
ncbi:OTU-like cysteine protease domain-containing protein [Cyclospora cayetanensis]|uniref:OTU-like cysteine protease domain-containing protein n=1 Tax=Cyclospora cayetanensis TaxID=88456 RepID=A0A1D3D1U7_9EIME|nr:OTU-like cysteine protease domain-containing protein [Cyclospora cayetanensis]